MKITKNILIFLSFLSLGAQAGWTFKGKGVSGTVEINGKKITLDNEDIATEESDTPGEETLEQDSSHSHTTNTHTTNHFGTVQGNVYISGGHVHIKGQSASSYPEIKPTGKTTEKELSQPLHTVSVPKHIATVYLSDTKKPCIKCDAAIEKIGKITAQDGKLKFKSTTNGYTLNSQKPLCTIYAKPAGKKITATRDASIILDNIPVTKILAKYSSSISGTVAPISTLTLNASGNSSITLKGITSSLLEIFASGTAGITAVGKADTQNVTLSGSSSYNGYKLSSLITAITASGNAQALLNVTKKLSGNASGISSITYTGKPLNNLTISGLATCKKA